ncbi:FAD-dependent oxidoreductase [Edaphobacter aggregans]|uniref:FAD-dependent oxidoreductase n=1 Tax=Edaphobacter aggregans TaxID=570835 RepID=UPI000553D010|nr:FAD-dependent oxidoreductase [Edaphobacter aggregans]
MTDAYDLVAIGAGPAGESATELASFFGHRSAVIERARPGGTVTTTGGAPTKTLREAALYFSGLSEGDVYGVRISTPPEIATDIIRKRTGSVCDLLQKVTAENIAKNDVDYIEGSARIDKDGRVTVTAHDGSKRKLHAKVILIATGSRPFRPTNLSFDIPGVCDTDTIMDRGRVPKDIVIVGGGPVGVEFATICHALGAKVTLVDRGTRLMNMMDRELSDCMEELFRKWCVTIFFGSMPESIRAKGDGLEVKLSNEERLFPDTVLFAAGRVANTEGLGLETVGIALDSRGQILVDEKFRTSAEGIYAAGDVLGPTLASIAMEQGRVAICHAFGIPFEGIVDPCPVSAVYGMPEVSGAGLTEEQCRERGLDYEVGRANLALTPRGAIAGRGGLLKLIFLKGDRKLVGVHCICDLASEIVGIGQMVIRCGGTMNTIANMSMNTPTYSYAYKYAAFDGLRRLVSRESEAHV